MEQQTIRTLRADEIECRVGSINEKGVSLLLYKDARCDMRILDEVYGTTNWQRSHELIGSACDIQAKDILKNNSVALYGVSVRLNGRDIAPTIYLDPYYEMYCKGMPHDKAIMQVLDTIGSQLYKDVGFDSKAFSNFENVKEKIVFRMVNARENEEMLKGIPHFMFLDFAVYFIAVYFIRGVGEGSITISQGHADMWGVDVDQLYWCAKANSQTEKREKG